VIRLLLENGADVHSMNDQGVTALGWAYSPPRDMGGSLSVQRRVVRLLKEYGATPVGAGRRRR
jgi:ankyrin repeat protein